MNRPIQQMTTKQIQMLHTKLMQKKAELDLRMEQINRTQRQPLPANSSEQAIELENQEVLDFLSHEAATELDKVNQAIQRMTESSYGQCNACGIEIAYQRLDAYPYAELCYQCAAQQEQ